jgi:GH24 family phage-related lysozyme (muramidase)
MTKKVLALSASALLIIAMHEGFSPTPYKDTAGVVTNGFGNATIEPSKPVTVLKALDDLKLNTSRTGKKVSQCLNANVTQGQYDSYISFAYNVGTTKFCNSTMLKKANAGDREGSCAEFDKWMYVAGKDCRIKSSNCSGIAKRREEEKQLCLS